MEGKENYTLNSIKFICAILIIFIHCPFPKTMGSVLIALARPAVPFFFICSGYFCYYLEKGVLRKKLPNKIINILKITVVTIVLYFIWECVLRIFGSSGNLEGFLFETLFTWQSFFSWIVFNEDVLVGPFWFLFSLLYCYLLLYPIEKFNLYKVSFILIPILLIINLLLSEFDGLLGWDISLMYYRNFLLTGFPFFMLGYFIHKDFSLIDKYINKNIAWLLFTIGIALSIIEMFLLGRSLLYIGSIFIIVAAFILAIQYPNFGKKFLSKMGDKYSLYMYCTHWFIIDVLTIVIKRLGGSPFAGWGYILPLIVVCITIISSICIYYFIQVLKNIFKGKKVG